MNYHFPRHFTLNEANRMVPHIRRLFHEVHNLLRADDAPHTSPNSPPPHYHSNGNGNGNGHNHAAPAQPTNYGEWSTEKRREAAYRLLNSLQEQSIVIQDIERGLIDFPALLNGREVFLCYELSDGDIIEYYHDLDAGFAGRTKIPEGRHGH